MVIKIPLFLNSSIHCIVRLIHAQMRKMSMSGNHRVRCILISVTVSIPRGFVLWEPLFHSAPRHRYILHPGTVVSSEESFSREYRIVQYSLTSTNLFWAAVRRLSERESRSEPDFFFFRWMNLKKMCIPEILQTNLRLGSLEMSKLHLPVQICPRLL